MIDKIAQDSHHPKSFFYNEAVIAHTSVRVLHLLVAFCIAFLFANAPTRASETTYRLTTGLSTGDFYPVGIALKTLLALKRTDDRTIVLDIQQSKGARANLIALLEGRADIAFVDANTILAALTKTPPFDKYKNVAELQSLAPLWSDIAHVIIRRAEVRSGQVEDFRNLIGQSVSFGSKTSAANYAARNLFSQMELDYSKMFRVPNHDLYQSTEAFLNDDLQGLALFSYATNKQIKTIMETARRDAILLNISDGQLKKLNQTQVPIWHRYIIAANTYPNQPNPIASIAQFNFLVVRQDFDKDDAHHIVKTLFENITFVRALHDAAKQIDRASLNDQLILQLHPGARRYFRESEQCRGIFCLFN